MDLSQKELGEQIGVSQVHIGRWERGDQLCRTDYLKKIADLSGRPISWFLGEVEEEKPTEVLGAIQQNNELLSILIAREIKDAKLDEAIKKNTETMNVLLDEIKKTNEKLEKLLRKEA